jgi:signal peptidase I
VAFLLWFPILQIHGNSMAPALTEGDLILCIKTDKVSQGQIAAFYHNNKLLVKRVIALAGDTVDIASDGKVYINGNPLSEPYIAELSAGVIDIPLPCRIPWDHAFMLGDNRPTSLDSRSSEIGTVPRERIFAVAVFRLWPLHRMGWI